MISSFINDDVSCSFHLALSALGDGIDVWSRNRGRDVPVPVARRR